MCNCSAQEIHILYICIFLHNIFVSFSKNRTLAIGLHFLDSSVDPMDSQGSRDNSLSDSGPLVICLVTHSIRGTGKQQVPETVSSFRVYW